ncbi:MAG: hypothetical protein WA208_04945 [Thermoanaerobaculia bacterium]
MRFRRLPLLLLLAFALACQTGGGTGETPGSADRPPMEVRQIGSLFFGSSYDTSVSLDFFIENNGTVPMKVWRILVQDAGMVQYQIPITSREFRRTIEPGKVERFTIVATAVTDVYRLSPNEPLLVRVTVDADREGKRFRALYLREPVFQGR